MKQLKKLSLTLLLLITAAAGAWAQGPWTSGDCTVTLNNGTLTVSGNGAMAEYENSSARPWYNNRNNITSVVVESGVTTVGEVAFADFSNLTSVTLPEGLTAISPYAFSICNSLTSITIPSTVTSIGNYTFFGSSSISDVNLYSNPTNLTWGDTSMDFKDSKATQCHVLAEHLSAYQTNFSSVNVTFVGDLQPLTPAVEVTINEAKTEATMKMPTFDVTLNYTLVRDMQDQANPVVFVGLPNSGTIVAKKGDDGKYQPTDELDIRLIDPLAANNAQNIIAADGITVTVEKNSDNTWSAAGTFADFMADMQPGTYRLKATPKDETSPYDGTVTSDAFTVVERYDLAVKPADDYSKGKLDKVVVGTEEVTPDANGEAKKTAIAPDTQVKLNAKRGYVIEKVETKKMEIIKLDAATAENIGMVVCNKGHLHDAKTAVPNGCTAVGILGKVAQTGHGLILALKNATNQNWNTINGWTSVTTYAGTTLKVLPANTLGTNLTSYTALGSTAVSNWAVAQKSDYEAIFTNLGSTKNSGGMTYDNNVNAYITTGVGGTAMSGTYWSATQDDDYDAWYFLASYWDNDYKTYTYYVRPVLGF